MDRQGTIFAHHPVKKKQPNEGLHGDSGVGQAPESPFKPSYAKASEGRPSKRLRSKTITSSKNRGLSLIGSALIIFSILGFTLTYGPIIKTELNYRIVKLLNRNNSSRGSFGDILVQTLAGNIDQIPDPNFSLIIPKINASSRVIPNVDPGNEAEYMAALKQGVAHAKGTYLPGGKGTVYLFAHSTDSPINIVRYNAVFYLLRELEAGDEVIVYFAGVKHRYSVTDKKIVEPTDTAYLMPENPLNKELLILQTCWPPGTRFKRLLIFAEKLPIPPEIQATRDLIKN